MNNLKKKLPDPIEEACEEMPLSARSFSQHIHFVFSESFRVRHESHSQSDFCCATRFLNKLSATGGDGDDSVVVCFCDNK